MHEYFSNNAVFLISNTLHVVYSFSRMGCRMGIGIRSTLNERDLLSFLTAP